MKSFRLTNVKSFEDTGDIELKPITVFVGPNSSGKSSLLRFPVILSQTYLDEAISPLIFNGKYVDYGNFEDVVHHHSGNELSFNLKFDMREHLRRTIRPSVGNRRVTFPPNPFRENHELSLDVTIRKTKNKIVVHQYQIDIDNKVFFSLQRKNNEYEINLHYHVIEDVELESPISFLLPRPIFEKFLFTFNFPYSIRDELVDMFEHIAEKKFNYNRYESSVISEALEQIVFDDDWDDDDWDDDDKLKLSAKDKEMVSYLNLIAKTLTNVNTISNMLNSYIKDFSQQMNYIGPFRTNPARTYRQSESLYGYVGTSGEYTSTLLRQAEQNQHPLFEKVSKWFSEAMGYQIGIEEITGSNLFRIKVYSEQKPDGDNLIDVGFGISQILPIVTQLYYAKGQEDEYRKDALKYSSDIFVIEQPELHLHPMAQAELANLFVERVLDEENEAQIIIETHSEHLIRRLQSLVANPDNKFSSNDVAIYYVDMKSAGNSMVKKMELTEQGQFKEKWPSGFFDKGYLLSKELIRYASQKAV